MSITKHHPGNFNLPLLQGILPWNNSTLVSDIAAGIVLAALGIPEVMGYTKISGTPIATGLYTPHSALQFLRQILRLICYSFAK